MKRHFQGLPTLDDFELKTEPLHPLKENEILIKPEYWSVDPYARIYPASFGFKLPMTMLGSQVSRVLASRHPRYPADSHVLAYTGWREVAALDPDKHYDTYGRGPTALPRVSCHWRRAGHVTIVLLSDWCSTAERDLQLQASLQELTAEGVAGEEGMQVSCDWSRAPCSPLIGRELRAQL